MVSGCWRGVLFLGSAVVLVGVNDIPINFMQATDRHTHTVRHESRKVTCLEGREAQWDGMEGRKDNRAVIKTGDTYV